MPMARRAKNEKQTAKTTKVAGQRPRRRDDADEAGRLPTNYWKACELVRDGQYKKARQAYARLEPSAANARVRTLTQNDPAVISAMGNPWKSAMHLKRVVSVDGLDNSSDQDIFPRLAHPAGKQPRSRE
jgi:hypothetical protein